MSSQVFQTAKNSEMLQPITNHAKCRMSGRSINEEKIDLVLTYGRSTHSRKAVIYAVGRREVSRFGKFLEECEGIHVLCSPKDGAILTTYRNHDLSRMKH